MLSPDDRFIAENVPCENIVAPDNVAWLNTPTSVMANAPPAVILATTLYVSSVVLVVALPGVPVAAVAFTGADAVSIAVLLAAAPVVPIPHETYL